MHLRYEMKLRSKSTLKSIRHDFYVKFAVFWDESLHGLVEKCQFLEGKFYVHQKFFVPEYDDSRFL
jgi:hypothetical protein